MNDKQYKLAKVAAGCFRRGEDAGPALDKFLDIATQVLGNPDSYTALCKADGKEWSAAKDLETFKAALKQHGRTAATQTTAPTHRPLVTVLPFIRCGIFTPDHQPGGMLNDGASEFKALAYHKSEALIPVECSNSYDLPERAYNAAALVKAGDAERVTDTDGSKWLRLTPQFFEKHGYEFTTDGKQIKPSRATLTAWLKRHTTPEQRQKGTVIHGDGFNGVTDELLRQGLAEADGLNQVKVSAKQFEDLGLTQELEAIA